ncbi:MAG: hypothetical protein FWC47_05075 [Oscillospiraceae bacterium]|nr:hypothetical protein [Oscillospiraceae bacterium]
MKLSIKDNIFLGSLLIFIGIIAFTIKISGVDLFYIPYAWPIFLIISGLSLEMSYLKYKKDLISVFAGSIFFIYGLSSFILNIFNVVPRELHLSLIYPEKFILFTICLGLAIACSQVYIFSRRNSKYLERTAIFISICVINILFIKYNEFFMNLIILSVLFGSGIYLIYAHFKYK